MEGLGFMGLYMYIQGLCMGYFGLYGVFFKDFIQIMGENMETTIQGLESWVGHCVRGPYALLF